MERQFGGMLRGHRVRAGLTQEDLAAASGVSARTVRALETAGRTPRPASVRRLAEALGLDAAATRDLLAAGRGDAEPAPRPPAAVPAELPHDAAGFTGRGAELARLDRGAPITLVVGPAGVGKTALAVRWAHRVRGRYPDGQLFVDLRGHDARRPPLPPDDALRRLLAGLGLTPHRIPDEPDEMARRYRTLLADRRLLLVLDNAADADQVRPLLPGTPGCRTVVTSRNRMTELVARDGARPLPLDVLPPDQTAALLTAVLGAPRTDAEPGAAAELARLCGHLPLAVRVAAALLAFEPGRPIADLAAELAERGRLAGLGGDPSVRAAFALSYEALDPVDRRLFRLLGTVPGPDFGIGAAAALARLPERETAARLAGLAAAHLVETRAAGRHRLHDLLRDYARERAAEDAAETEAALDRLYDWYLHRTDAAVEALPWQIPRARAVDRPAERPAERPLGEARAAAWLGAEQAGLLAAVDHAAATGRPAAAWHLADALLRHLWLALPRPAWDAVARTALDAAAAAGDPRGEAAMRRSLGFALWDAGRLDAARAHHARARELSRTAGPPLAEGLALLGLGLVERDTARLGNALGHLDAALRIARDGGHAALAGRALTGLGHVRRQAGELAAAAADHTEAARVHAAAGLRPEVLHAAGLAAVRVEQGRSAEAVALLAPWTSPETAGHPARHTLASALTTAALARLALGEAGEARGRAAEALALARESGRRIAETAALAALAEAELGGGRPAEAAAAAEEAVHLARELGHPRGEADGLLARSAVRLDRGAAGAAAEDAKAALAVAEASGLGRVAERARAQAARAVTAGR